PRLAGVVEQVEEHLNKLLTPTRDRTALTDHLDRERAAAQSEKLCDLPRHRPTVDHLQRTDLLRWRRAIACERPRSPVEPIDFLEQSFGSVRNLACEIRIVIGTQALQVLQTEPHRGERVLDLVCHLASHLTPGNNPRGTCSLLFEPRLALAEIALHLLDR